MFGTSGYLALCRKVGDKLNMWVHLMPVFLGRKGGVNAPWAPLQQAACSVSELYAGVGWLQGIVGMVLLETHCSRSDQLALSLVKRSSLVVFMAESSAASIMLPYPDWRSASAVFIGE